MPECCPYCPVVLQKRRATCTMIDAFLLSLLQYRGSDLRTAALSGATIPKHTAGQARRRHTVEIKALLYTFKGLQRYYRTVVRHTMRLSALAKGQQLRLLASRTGAQRLASSAARVARARRASDLRTQARGGALFRELEAQQEERSAAAVESKTPVGAVLCDPLS